MLFVMTMTLWSLVIQAGAKLTSLGAGGAVSGSQIINGIVDVLLGLLAAALVLIGGRVLLQPAPVGAAAAVRQQ